MMTTPNKATARRFFDEAFSGGRLEVIDELFTADYRDHDPANGDRQTRGAEALRQEVAENREAFDLTFVVEDQIAEGDEVLTRWSCTGTHRGEFLGVPPTGAEVSITGMTLFRFRDGRIEEGWFNWDTLGLFQQIGAVET
ncbi:ester cyclase [Streptomyces sp. URMC 123]|uniref:ester cyclase n=1 Tax=Streptomyces sp. URMC 123 TaxID=3423403 RepID=UPI003F1D2D7C